MRVGICGFPGSGKSTLFQALSPGAPSSRGGVILGNIKVPDERIDRLAEIFNPKKKVYAEITFMDLENAEGKVGGAFPPPVVQAMRNADVLVHVVRAFENPRVETAPDPSRDLRAFEEELILLDLAIIEKRTLRFQKENRKGMDVDVNARCQTCLEEGRPLRSLTWQGAELATLQGIQLLSLAPLLTVFSVTEEDWATSPWRKTGDPGHLAVCGKLEAEIANLPEEEQKDFLEALELGEPARNGFIRAAYAALDLISFLTAGEDECRAWPVRRGSNARTAAGKVHSDIERGFIRAEVYRLEDLERLGSEAALKKAGKIRVEGRDYIVQDGDVVNYRFNV